MTPPTISVVTVCRNDLPGLQSTWLSLTDQRLDGWQWVVVDGASTDGTADWLTSVADPRVQATSEPDNGIYDAMNKGMVAASGRLVLFLNAGDRLHTSGTLGQVCASQLADRWAWAYGRVRVVDREGRVLRLAHFEPFRPSLLRLGYRAIPHQAAVFTRSLLERLGGYRLEAGLIADQELMLRAAREQPPCLLRATIADFLAGGASWGRPSDVFVREARAIRVADGDLLMGNALVDALGTEVLAADKRGRTWVRRRVLREPIRW